MTLGGSVAVVGGSVGIGESVEVGPALVPGPIVVSDLVDPSPLSAILMRAAEQAGIPRTRDFNGATQEGVGMYQATLSGARRCSAAHGYLRPARNRTNLEVRTGERSRQL